MLAPLVEEHDGESKQQETEGFVEDKVEEVREETVVLLLSEKEECSCASDDKYDANADDRICFIHFCCY